MRSEWMEEGSAAVVFATLSDVRRIELPCHVRDDGELVVVEEGKAIPFPVLRTFTVRAPAAAVRGRHAHRRCAQFFMCVHGSIEVECDDGEQVTKFALDSGHVGLLVPPTIWASQMYLVAGAVLSVLCDRHYEEDDYIRDYETFRTWRKRASHE